MIFYLCYLCPGIKFVKSSHVLKWNCMQIIHFLCCILPHHVTKFIYLSIRLLTGTCTMSHWGLWTSLCVYFGEHIFLFLLNVHPEAKPLSHGMRIQLQQSLPVFWSSCPTSLPLEASGSSICSISSSTLSINSKIRFKLNYSIFISL